MERSTLSRPSVEELQESVPNSPNSRCIPAEMSMPITAAPAVGFMTSPWCYELQNNSVASLQLAEFLDTKMADWDDDLRDKVEPLAYWTHEACIILVAKEED